MSIGLWFGIPDVIAEFYSRLLSGEVILISRSGTLSRERLLKFSHKALMS